VAGIGYHLKEGLMGFGASRGGSISAVLISALAILLMGIFLTISFNIFKIVEEAQSEVQMEVFLEDDADYNKVEVSIARVNGVMDMFYVSKEQAEEEFRRAFKEDRGLLDVLDKNYFPASFRLKIDYGYRSSKGMAEIAESISEIDGVEDVEYAKVWLERLERVAKILRTTGIITGVVFSIVAMVIIAGAIKLSIYARKKKIAIMMLVGASNSFIRSPFLIEGALIGIVGGLFACGAIYAIIFLVNKYTIIHPTSPPLEYMLALIGFSFLIGVISAQISVSSFLREDG